MLGAVLGGLNHPMDSREAQAQWGQGWATLHRAGKCKTSEKGWPSSWNQETTFLQAGHGQRAGIPSGSLSLSQLVLPCRAAGSFVTRAIDGRAGAVVQVMSRSESLVLLCQLTRGEGVDTCVRSLTTQRAPGAANGIASVCAAGRRTKGAAASTDADAEERGQDADGGVGS